jgi:hypothetical protein
VSDSLSMQTAQEREDYRGVVERVGGGMVWQMTLKGRLVGGLDD